MNRILLAFAVLALTTVSYSQERFRQFDNFDTSRGVKIYKPDFMPIGGKAGSAIPATKLSRGKRLVLKTGSQKPLPPPARMNVSEGLATRELNRTYSSMKMG